MAQIFQGDAQQLAASVTITTTTETNGPLSNPLKVPYLNGKILVRASAQVSTGTGVTSLQIRVRRNQNNENVVLGTVNNIVAAASSLVAITLDFVDIIPDGRDCVYTLTVQQVGATGNGQILAGSLISAMVMSG